MTGYKKPTVTLTVYTEQEVLTTSIDTYDAIISDSDWGTPTGEGGVS